MNKFPVLDLSKFESDENFNQIQFQKLQEEVAELDFAIDRDDKENTLEECLDIIQVIIPIILQYSKESIDKAFKYHVSKLKSRGWNIKNYVMVLLQKFTIDK